MKDYYLNELNKIDTTNQYPANIKIHGGSGEATKHLDLNAESAETLVKWLTAHYLTPKDVTVDMFTKIKRDTNGNPRYVIDFIKLSTIIEQEEVILKANTLKGTYSTDLLYKIALKRAKQLGGRKYDTKAYSGGIVFQSYNIQDTADKINELLNK